RRMQAKHLGIAPERQLTALVAGVDRSTESSSGLDPSAGVCPRPVIPIDRNLQILGQAIGLFFPAHASLDLHAPRLSVLSGSLQLHSPGDRLRIGVEVDLDIGLVGQERFLEALVAKTEPPVNDPHQQSKIRLVLEDRLESLEQINAPA